MDPLPLLFCFVGLVLLFDLKVDKIYRGNYDIGDREALKFRYESWRAPFIIDFNIKSNLYPGDNIRTSIDLKGLSRYSDDVLNLDHLCRSEEKSFKCEVNELALRWKLTIYTVQRTLCIDGLNCSSSIAYEFEIKEDRLKGYEVYGFILSGILGAPLLVCCFCQILFSSFSPFVLCNEKERVKDEDVPSLSDPGDVSVEEGKEEENIGENDDIEHVNETEAEDTFQGFEHRSFPPIPSPLSPVKNEFLPSVVKVEEEDLDNERTGNSENPSSPSINALENSVVGNPNFNSSVIYNQENEENEENQNGDVNFENNNVAIQLESNVVETMNTPTYETSSDINTPVPSGVDMDSEVSSNLSVPTVPFEDSVSIDLDVDGAQTYQSIHNEHSVLQFESPLDIENDEMFDIDGVENENSEEEEVNEELSDCGDCEHESEGVGEDIIDVENYELSDIDNRRTELHGIKGVITYFIAINISFFLIEAAFALFIFFGGVVIVGFLMFIIVTLSFWCKC